MCQWNPTLAQRSRKDGAPRRLEHQRHLRYTSASNLNREMTVVTLRQPAFDSSPITVRKARAEDAPVCGRICYEAFTKISTEHGFPPDFPSVEVATGVLSMMFSHPGFYCVVAESGGQILGSNCLDERSAIAGVGPITIDPEVQNKGVGRALMEAVLARSAQRGFQGARLLQAAFHNRSLSLYTKLGFDTREPISTMQGPAIKASTPGYSVRPARLSDLEECNRLCRRVHGHDRSGELCDAIEQGTAVVAERDGRIVAYSTSIGFFGHTVGESNADVQALIANADVFLGPGILVPTRNAGLFRWCLENGLRVVQPMTLMTLGFYNEPAGAWLPSILY
jgi:GNAT superfamily N-acetyltransferase